MISSVDRNDKAQAVFDSLTREEDDVYLQCSICVEVRLHRWGKVVTTDPNVVNNDWSKKPVMYDPDTWEQLRLMQCRVCKKCQWVASEQIRQSQASL